MGGKTKPERTFNGIGEGRGTTSTGVHYDTRIHPTDMSPQEIRRQALERAEQELRAAQAKKENHKPKKQNRSTLLTAGAVVVFAAVALFGGDAIWDAVTTTPSVSPLPVYTAQQQTEAPLLLEAAALPTAVQDVQMPETTQVPVPVGVRSVGEITVEPVQLSVHTTVWVPASGSRYHTMDSCSGMKEAREVSLIEAKEDGFTPCKRCSPPE